MIGMSLAEESKVVNILPPLDANGSARTGDRFSMKGAARASLVLQLGVTGAATTVTVKECNAVTGGTATAIVFRYRKEDTDSGDTLDAWTTATTSGFTTSTNNNIFYVIEIEASELSDGYEWIELNLSDPGQATLASAVAVLTGLRYAQNAPATAIA